MAYKALYRTYRPQSFDDIIGQESVVKTLKNEIKEKKISHAYLFCGPRGTGKTTIARIFAKALNCPFEENSEPCNKCDICREITEGLNPDVIEIDAASNNGVEEIRAMKDRIGFLPAGSKYKVYIIDEVHMLSTSAFNALLKTLEEPPKHVIFILATTEPHKVLPTVLSRCQRFDFKSLTVDQIMYNLEKVCVEEKYAYEEEALKHIAIASDGGMRDALSYLDQVMSFASGEITDKDASSVTGLLTNKKITELAMLIKEKKLVETLNLVKEFYEEGKEVRAIVNGLLSFYRDLLLEKNLNQDNIDTIAYKFSFEEIFTYIDILSEVQNQMKYSSSPAIYLEVALIKMNQLTVEDFDFHKRLSRLEEQIKNVSFETGGQVANEPSRKMIDIEDRLNSLLSYLSKLKLQEINDRITVLEKKPDISNDNSRIDLLEKSLLELQTKDNEKVNKEVEYRINVIDEKIKALDNDQRNEELNNKVNSLDQKIERFINEISEKLNNINHEDNKQIINRVDDLELKLLEAQEQESDNQELEKKIESLEERITKLNSIFLQTINNLTVPKKSKQKVNTKQVSFWSEDTVEDTKANIHQGKEKFDFDELTIEKPVDNKVPENQMNIYNFIDEETNEPKEENNVILEEVKEEKEPEVQEKQISRFENTDHYSDNIVKDIIEKERVEQENDEDINFFKTEEPRKQEVKEILTHNKEEIIRKNNESEIINKANETQEELGNYFADEKKLEEPKSESDLDEYERYEISILERILDDSRKPQCIGDKQRLMNLWDNLEELVSSDKRAIASLLKEGAIRAVGNHEFVITYEKAQVCNQVMGRKFKRKSLKLLYDLLLHPWQCCRRPDSVSGKNRRNLCEEGSRHCLQDWREHYGDEAIPG